MTSQRGLVSVLLALIVVTPAAARDRNFDDIVTATKAAVLSHPAEAVRLAQNGERAALLMTAQRDRQVALATVYWLRGEAFTQLGKPRQATQILAQALRLAHVGGSHSTLTGEILLSIGNNKSALGQSAEAFRYYENAHRTFQTTDDTRNQALSLLYISSLYGDANDYTSSLRYIRQARELRFDDPQLDIAIWNNTASILRELKRFREAESAYRHSYQLASNHHAVALQARILGSVARLRLKMGDTRTAAHLIAKASRLPGLVGADAATLHPLFLEVLAQTAFQQHRYLTARALIEERFGGVDSSATTLVFREAHQTAYDIYNALNNSAMALGHLAALKRLDDQATRLATSANAALAAARFDFANQELQLATLQRDDANRRVAYARKQAATERAIFTGVVLATVIVIALLTVWLVSVFRGRRRERTAAIDLAATNDALGKALAAKTEFLATTSHEIRTPLNGILGMTQVMLADRGMPADARDRLTIVHGAGLTMRALVDDILDVAKMETGNIAIECAPFDLRATLAEAGRLWAEQARAKGVAFEVDLADSPGWITGDAARVRQIAFNLLSNALKFTERGRVMLSADRNGETYRIRVQDSGIGIADDQIGHIFESFRQADASTTRRFGGTGLGLTICRNLAHAMKGTIAVESEVGRGTIFTVTLPLTTSCPADDGEDQPSGIDRVVVVDASPISRATLRTLVAKSRPDPIAVDSMSQASRIADGAELILVDQNAVDDVAGLARLAAAAPVAVLWRGDAPPEIATIARVIAKPIDAATLAATLFAPAVQPSLVREVA